jgi:hypothetical protein
MHECYPTCYERVAKVFHGLHDDDQFAREFAGVNNQKKQTGQGPLAMTQRGFQWRR